MLTQHIALVPDAGGVNLSDLARVSAALQRQAMEHLAPVWGVSASVDAFPYLEDVPAGYWPILVSPWSLGHDAGVHQDENGQPYARIELSPSWSLDASRACLEMLVNPLGDRTVTAASPRASQDTVELLVEVCGPCGAGSYSYPINDVLVADFCTPAFFGSALGGGSRDSYSFHGFASRPFRALPGGRLVWLEALSNHWWLRSQRDQDALDAELGTAEPRRGALRALMRGSELFSSRATALSRGEVDAQSRLLREHGQRASRARAERLRLLCSGASAIHARAYGVEPDAGAGPAERRLAAGDLDSMIREELHECTEDDAPALLSTPRSQVDAQVDAAAAARSSSLPPPLARKSEIPSLSELPGVGATTRLFLGGSASRSWQTGWVVAGGAFALVAALGLLQFEGTRGLRPSARRASASQHGSAASSEPPAISAQSTAQAPAPAAVSIPVPAQAESAPTVQTAAPVSIAPVRRRQQAARRQRELSASAEEAKDPAAIEDVIDSRR